jgi:hypothetical protein
MMVEADDGDEQEVARSRAYWVGIHEVLLRFRVATAGAAWG